MGELALCAGKEADEGGSEKEELGSRHKINVSV
jgi:hypothetical protein